MTLLWVSFLGIGLLMAILAVLIGVYQVGQRIETAMRAMDIDRGE